jgi:hypothetical protein
MQVHRGMKKRRFDGLKAPFSKAWSRGDQPGDWP